MAINRLVPASFSTEGIATIKITGIHTRTELPTAFAAGTYRIDTGYSGTISVKLFNETTLLNSVTFATSASITIASTATHAEILSPPAATNGLVAFQFLSRGVDSTAYNWASITLAQPTEHRYADVIANTNGVYIVGGHNNTDNGWNSQGGSGYIEKWDRTSSTTTVVLTNSALSYGIQAVGVGTDIYFITHQNSNTPLYKFDTNTNTLSTLAQHAYQTPISPIVVNNQGTKIYTIGSYGGSYSGAIQEYTIATNTWSVKSTTQFPWAGGGYGGSAWTDPSNDDYIYIANMEGQTNVYRYSISANTFTSLAASCTNGVYQTRGFKSPTGNHYWKPQSADSTSTLSTGWYDVFSADGTTSYLNAADNAAQIWSGLVFKGSTPPLNHQGVSITRDSTYMYATGFVGSAGAEYFGKLLYKQVARAFPSSGFGS